MEITIALKNEFPNLELWQIENVIKLIDDGNTIPFIARYRKEQHGELNDQLIRSLADRLTYLRNFNERRDEIRASLIKLEVYTDELGIALDSCTLLAGLEDIYRPYKPKRRTRAMIAKENGLEPLAVRIMLQQKTDLAPIVLAEEYLNEEKGIDTREKALAGAMDIIAEQFSDDAHVRTRLRSLIEQKGEIVTKAAKQEDSVYRMYYDYSEPVSRIAGHRVLAIDRGEREGFLKVSIQVDEETALNLISGGSIKNGTPAQATLNLAVKDAYSRLIMPSMEREARSNLTNNAQEAAISVFALNLNDLLMQPPIKDEVVLGFDPGIRTGCKLAVIDKLGRVLDTGVIYPLPQHKRVDEAGQKVKSLIEKYGVTLCAIGNGTASRETERFYVDLMHNLNKSIPYVIVNEAGASVYSASKLAADEFPEYDVSIRSAVSIARRLQDPLAELVKIDPAAIGVGQYQHDMRASRLNEALGGVVERCVNQVGVELNTASVQLLCHVSGISESIAKNIIKFRDENGAFSSRSQLKSVPKLGPKAFEQCAGFLRIAGGDEPLDNTGVHPEAYSITQSMLKRFGYTKSDIRAGKLSTLGEAVGEVGVKVLAAELSLGTPTLRDIVRELVRPGRDPRDELPKPILRTDVLELSDLVPDMELKGTVRNVIDFGAFVDIGVHRDGLVHISELSNKRVKHPSEVVKVGDIVTVWVKEVDAEKNRISLSMKKPG